MHPILFELGPISLKFYGLFMAIAFWVGIVLAKRRAAIEGIDPKNMETLAFWLIIAGVVGARILYTFILNSNYYFRHPIDFFFIHQGGLSFFGSLYTVVPALWFLCRKKGLFFGQVIDIFAPSLAIGLGFGKIGCFLAGCCYGAACDLPWAVRFDDPLTLAHPRGELLHPLQLYEGASWILLYFLLIRFRRSRTFFGEVFLLFAVCFGTTRSMLEVFRAATISDYYWGLTTFQIMSIPVVFLSLVVWFFLRRHAISSRTLA